MNGFRKMHGRLILVICLCLLDFSSLLVQAQDAQYFLEGDVYSEVKIKLAKGSSPNTVTHFQVAVSNSNWNIKMERAGNVYTIKTEAGSTGTNAEIYAVSYIRKNSSNNWDVLAASARPGPIPYILADPMIQVLWFAFVSQHLYPQDGRQSSPQIFVRFSLELNNAQFSVLVDVKHDPRLPYFLSRGVMFEDGIRRYWEEEEDAWVQPPEEEPLPYPYEHGYTNCIFAVDEFGEIGPMAWPKKFSFVQNGMKNRATNAADLDLFCVMTGSVTNFESEPQVSSFIPEVPKGMIVNDERFIWDAAPVFSFTYPSTGQWLTKDEVTNTPAYKAQIKEQLWRIPVQKARPREFKMPVVYGLNWWCFWEEVRWIVNSPRRRGDN